MRRSLISMLAIIAMVISLFASVSYAATTTTVNSDGPNSGQDAYQIFKSYFGSNPIDGPSSGYISEKYDSEVGNVFEFYAPADGMYDGSNTDRQRNELKVYGSSPNNLKATHGSTFTYKWKFKVMNGYAMTSGFNHIFQIKAYGGSDAGAPVYTFTVTGNALKFRHSPIGATMDEVEVLASTPWSNVVGNWLEATVVVENTDNGTVKMTLKKLDGTTLMSYNGTKDNWRSGAEFNRPKWGIYRKIESGMGEGKIRFANFQISDTDTMSSNPPSSGEFDGYYKIIARHSGKAIVVANASTSNSANIIQYSYGGSATNDEWDISSIGGGYYKILARHSGKAMVVEGASTSSGANVFQYTYGGSATNDEWKIIDVGGGYYKIENRNSGKVLDVQGKSTENNANIQQYTSNGGTNQQFQIISVQ